MHSSAAAPVRRRPPVAAVLAVPFALLSALAVAFFGFLALAFSEGDLSGNRWLFVAVPALLAVVLVIGAFLLLLGRSWLVLCLPAAALALCVIAGVLDGTLGDGTGGFILLAWALPGVVAILSALPGVRRWVAARRGARRTRGSQPAPSSS
ncbi:MAG: rane protein of unknown function [Modestobacter sp.]|nr:rane protein of unknown function [Modestobacter sp.]